MNKMEKVFKNGSKHDYREILIKSKRDQFEFYFYQQYLRQLEWIGEETERRLEAGIDDLSEDESVVHEFYWIDKNEWIKDINNWHNHMREKNWVTEEMIEWMDKNCI